MDDFLGEGYKVPESAGKYMKWQAGENRFRILAKPVVGYEGWAETADGRKPLRKPMNADGSRPEFSLDEVEDPEKIKHFWAMPVWNYATGSVQTLEITQRTIQTALASYARNKKWGSPLHYDIVVVKDGEGMDTSYEILVEPKEELIEAAQAAWNKVKGTYDAKRLFDNGDPFGDKEELERIAASIN